MLAYLDQHLPEILVMLSPAIRLWLMRHGIPWGHSLTDRVLASRCLETESILGLWLPGLRAGLP